MLKKAICELLVIIVIVISFFTIKNIFKPKEKIFNDSTSVVMKNEVEKALKEDLEKEEEKPKEEIQTEQKMEEPQVIEETQPVSVPIEEPQQSYSDQMIAKLTHYGPDCSGCSGTTASGYNVSNTIWYEDPEYGPVRVVATGSQLPLYSIIRLNDYMDGNVLAIVLDRGVSGNVIDILVESEAKASQLGIKRDATVDILRRGK